MYCTVLKWYTWPLDVVNGDFSSTLQTWTSQNYGQCGFFWWFMDFSQITHLQLGWFEGFLLRFFTTSLNYILYMPCKYGCCEHENTCYIYESYVLVIDHTSTQGTAFYSSFHQLTMLRDPTLLVPWWRTSISSGHRKWIQGWHWSHGPCNCCQVGGFFEDCNKNRPDFEWLQCNVAKASEGFCTVPGYSLKVPEVWGNWKSLRSGSGVLRFFLRRKRYRGFSTSFPQGDFGEFGWFWRPGSSGRFWSVHPKSSGGSWKVPIGSGVLEVKFEKVPRPVDFGRWTCWPVGDATWFLGIRAISPELVLLVESLDSDISKYLPPG